MYGNEVDKFAKLHEELDALYEMEIKVLSDKKSCEVLPQSVKERLSNEFAFMAKRVNLGMRSPNEQIEFLLSDKNIADLRDDFQTECPTLWDVMRSLFPVDGEGNTKKKEMSFAHALSILISLKDRSLRNDVKLCFSLLLQSFGVGCRLMNFLCKMSLTYSWETLGKYLDAFMENKLLHICKKASMDVPIILLMDNINVYRGNKKYHRLFATFGPKMWNFTGRGIFFPNTEGIEHLFSDTHTASESQRDILNLLAEDLMIYGNDAHLEIWNDWKDKFLLQGLDSCLNRFPRSLDLTSANEKGFDEWLKKFKPDRKNDNYKITMKDDFSSHLPTGVQKKSDVSALPLSLENNSTVAGAGAILQEFASMFDIPCKQPPTYLPYDSANKVFSLKQARTHCEYVRLLDDHKKI